MRFTLSGGVTSLGFPTGSLDSEGGVFTMPDRELEAAAVAQAIQALGLTMTVLPDEPAGPSAAQQAAAAAEAERQAEAERARLAAEAEAAAQAADKKAPGKAK